MMVEVKRIVEEWEIWDKEEEENGKSGTKKRRQQDQRQKSWYQTSFTYKLKYLGKNNLRGCQQGRCRTMQ